MDDGRLYAIGRRPHAGDGRPWRSLRELEAEVPAANRRMEFPPPPGDDPSRAGLDRRDFMKWTGTALAASSAGCAIEVPRKIVPYTRQPPEVVPGISTFYATS